MIMICNLLIIFQALLYGIIQMQENPNVVHLDPEARPHDYQSIFPFIPKIAFAFEYQVYFMIVYPYLSQTKKYFSGKQLAATTSLGMLTYCLVFSLLAIGSHQIVLNSYGIVELEYSNVPYSSEIMDWTIIISQMLQIPFKFYMGKEFVFILLDEMRNKSVSAKIDDLKKYMGNRKLYSENMVQRVRNDLYRVIRMPYMKLSNS